MSNSALPAEVTDMAGLLLGDEAPEARASRTHGKPPGIEARTIRTQVTRRDKP